jgi:protein gp37
MLELPSPQRRQKVCLRSNEGQLMNKTSIEWAIYTWNVLRGCSWTSPGYDHCYAEEIARRFGKAGQAYEGTYDYQADSWSGEVFFDTSTSWLNRSKCGSRS